MSINLSKDSIFIQNKVGKGKRPFVAQMNKYGDDYEAIFKSAREASKFTGINNNSISMCCRGELRTAGGYIWRYVMKNPNEDKKFPTEPGIYKVENTTFDVLERYDTISEAAKKNNLAQPNISNCINNKRGHETVGGYRWIRVPNRKSSKITEKTR